MSQPTRRIVPLTLIAAVLILCLAQYGPALLFIANRLQRTINPGRHGVLRVVRMIESGESPVPPGAIPIGPWLDRTIGTAVRYADSANAQMTRDGKEPAELFGRIEVGPIDWVPADALEDFCKQHTDPGTASAQKCVRVNGIGGPWIVVSNWRSPWGTPCTEEQMMIGAKSVKSAH